MQTRGRNAEDVQELGNFASKLMAVSSDAVHPQKSFMTKDG